MKKELKIFLTLFGVSILILFFIFIAFYIYYDLNRSYDLNNPIEEINNPLYPVDVNPNVTDNQDFSVENVGVASSSDTTYNTIINRKSNLNLEDIKNTVYYVLDNVESNFVDGKFKGRFFSSEILRYSFGDINGDGSGDAIVITTTKSNNLSVEEFHVVINKNGIPKVIKINPPLGEGDTVVNFNSVSIKSGKIILDMDISKNNDSECCSLIKKTIIYKFVNQNIVPVENAISWKNYSDSKFGFQFMYPGDLKPVVKSVYLDGKEVFDSVNVVLPIKFDNSYNTWDRKTFEISVLKQACPFRDKAVVVAKNGIDFYFYNPDYEETSDDGKILKQEEYMATKVGYCFIITNNVSGPGVKSPNYPKSSIITAPPDIYEFFNQEFIILDRILETFKFI